MTTKQFTDHLQFIYTQKAVHHGSPVTSICIEYQCPQVAYSLYPGMSKCRSNQVVLSASQIDQHVIKYLSKHQANEYDELSYGEYTKWYDYMDFNSGMIELDSILVFNYS